MTHSSWRQLLYGLLLGFSLSVTATSLTLWYQNRKREQDALHFDPRPIELRSDEIVDGVVGLIGE
jgi:cysteine synthase